MQRAKFPNHRLAAHCPMMRAATMFILALGLVIPPQKSHAQELSKRFRFSSFETPFILQGYFEGSFVIKPGAVHVFLSRATIRRRSDLQPTILEHVTALTWHLAHMENGRWNKVKGSQSRQAVDRILGVGESFTLSDLQFVLPYDGKSPLSSCWLLAQMEATPMNVPQDKQRLGHCYAHSPRDIFIFGAPAASSGAQPSAAQPSAAQPQTAPGTTGLTVVDEESIAQLQAMIKHANELIARVEADRAGPTASSRADVAKLRQGIAEWQRALQDRQNRAAGNTQPSGTGGQPAAATPAPPDANGNFKVGDMVEFNLHVSRPGDKWDEKYTLVGKILQVLDAPSAEAAKYYVRRMASTNGDSRETNVRSFQVHPLKRTFADEYDPKYLFGSWRLGRGGQITFSEGIDGSTLLKTNELSFAAYEGQLSINGNGSYVWRVRKDQPPLWRNWIKSDDPDYPIRLLRGDNGEDWLVGPFGKDEKGNLCIRLKSAKAGTSVNLGTEQIWGVRIGQAPYALPASTAGKFDSSAAPPLR
ncbi:MAG: hypothetical protein M3347_12705 [Armatimonadota bacterium]|nr:hypothetical protein [Armatimonadota bacterium]